MVGRIIAVEVGNPVAIRGDHHGLVLTEFDGVAGVGDERRDIGTQEHFTVADPDDQWRRAPRSHDGAGIVGMGEDQCEMAFESAHDRQRGADEIPGGGTLAIGAGHQMHGDLGVGVAAELHAVGLKFAAQRGVVLDDSVVHHGEVTGGVAMRVRVAVGRAAVGGPAGVADAGRSTPLAGVGLAGVGLAGIGLAGIGLGQCGLQVRQAASPAANREPALPVEDGQSGGVITPVLHPAQGVDDDLPGGTVPHVRHDSAHEYPG